MPKISILSAGQHDKSVANLIADYERRLSRDYDLSWRLVPGGDNVKEVASLKSELSGKLYVALDERGTNVSTAEIAEYMESKKNQGWNEIVFVIGGAYGLDDDIRDSAEKVWAFGRITLPHQIMRVLLAEQLYRANAINSNHPYHHN